MDEVALLGKLYEELNIDSWWKELLGEPNSDGFYDEDLAAIQLPYLDDKAATIIAEKFGKRISYVSTNEQWFMWNGIIHNPCIKDFIALQIASKFHQQLDKAMEELRKQIYTKAAIVEKSDAKSGKENAQKIRDKFEKGPLAKNKTYRDRLGNSSGMESLTKTMRLKMSVPSQWYEEDYRWFVMRNCVLDIYELRKGMDHWGNAWHSHSPDRPVTKYFDADFDPTAYSNGAWKKFLERSLPNESTRLFLQKVVGAAFMGIPKLRCIPNLYGPPKTGKSVFLGTMHKLGKEGAGYVDMPDSNAVIKSTGQNWHQVAFHGRRFIAVSEPSDKDQIDDDFLKKFSGDEWVETRNLREKSSGWRPQGVVFIASNKPLRINTRDAAIIERIHMIEFPVKFEQGEDVPEERRQIVGLEDMIMDDRSSVLNWIINGMIGYVEDGCTLHIPNEVLDQRIKLVSGGSSALRWVEEMVEDEFLMIEASTPPQYLVDLQNAYDQYVLWMDRNGERGKLSRRNFVLDIESRFSESIKHDGSKKLARLKITTKWQTYMNSDIYKKGSN